MACKFSSLISAHFSDLLHVAFVTHQDFADPRVRKPFDLMHPLSHIVKGVTVCHIVDNDYAMCTSVVAASQSSESLLSGSVPLKPHLLEDISHLQSEA